MKNGAALTPTERRYYAREVELARANYAVQLRRVRQLVAQRVEDVREISMQSLSSHRTLMLAAEVTIDPFSYVDHRGVVRHW